MKTKLVRIGNSQGVRIPRPLLVSVGLTDDVEISVEGSALVLRAVVAHPRAGWADEMDRLGPDDLDLDDLPASDWGEEEWTWPEGSKSTS